MEERFSRYMSRHNKFIYIIFSLLIFIGVILRFYNLRSNTSFNWDQENSVAYPAKEIIINHHFPLIGPRTGVGDLRLGPFYFYLAALFFAFFRMDPVSGAILAASLATLTLIISFILIKKIFSQPIAFYFVLIWATSTFVIFLDRIPWNVNLFPLSSLLITSGLWLLLKGERNRAWLAVGLGLFLGVNSHFSVVFLICTILIFLILNKRFVDKSIYILFILVFLTLLPVLIFELRHNFILTNNLFKFSSGFITSPLQLFNKTVNTISITLETVGRILLFDGPKWVQEMTTFTFLSTLVFLRKESQIRLFLKVFSIYLAVYILGFVFYSGVISEYYYIGLLPITTIGYSLVLSIIQRKFPSFYIYLIILFSVILFRSITIVHQENPQGLKVKQTVVEKIRDLSGGEPIMVVLDMDLGHSFGYDYLFDYYKIRKIPQKESGNILWISYPVSRFPSRADYIFGDLALGLPETTKKIFKTKEVELYSHLFKLRVPKDWEVLQCSSIDFDKYLLTQSQSASCQTFSQETEGIVVYNLPKCNIWEMEEKVELKIKSGLPLYIIPGERIHSFIEETKVVITAFERDRCIVFQDLIKKNGEFSPIFLEILESAKR